MKTKPDFSIHDDGSILLLFPLTRKARAWTANHLPDDAPTFGHAYAIEHNYVRNILNGILADGLTLGSRVRGI